MKITIISRDMEFFSTDKDRVQGENPETIKHYTILSDTYMLQESTRLVKFNNALEERITIPMENISKITEEK